MLFATIAGVLLIVTGVLARQGRLRRFAFLGIRLPATMRSEEAWYAAHRAAAPAYLVSGAAALVGAAVTPWWEPALLTAMLAVVLGMLAAGILAVRGQRGAP